MKRFTIPIVVQVEVVVDAEDVGSAIAEARRIVENGEPQDGFLEGWNQVQHGSGAPLIESIGEFRVADVDATDVVVSEVPESED